MTDYVKQIPSFIGLRGTVSDPSIFDTEFNLLETVSRTKADRDLPNTFSQAQTFNVSPKIPAGGTGNQPLTATEVTAKIASLEAALKTLLAPIDSPAFTGSPTGVTAPAGDSSSLLATTAFVNSLASSFVPPTGYGTDIVTTLSSGTPKIIYSNTTSNVQIVKTDAVAASTATYNALTNIALTYSLTMELSTSKVPAYSLGNEHYLIPPNTDLVFNVVSGTGSITNAGWNAPAFTFALPAKTLATITTNLVI